MIGLKSLTIGVLALQGAFAKHAQILKYLGVQVLEVRRVKELSNCQALIIPGGESTAMMKLIETSHLIEPLHQFAKHQPLFGTCAGLIIMAKNVIENSFIPWGCLDITVERNAFGRQADSFKAEIECQLDLHKSQLLTGFFIRAPRIKKWGEKVEILGLFNQEPVLIAQGQHLAATFHAELTNQTALHTFFLKRVQNFL